MILSSRIVTGIYSNFRVNLSVNGSVRKWAEFDSEEEAREFLEEEIYPYFREHHTLPHLGQGDGT